MELVLNTFGTSLSRDKECFVIVHKDGKQRLPPKGIRSIQIGRGAQVTSDAVMLAIEQEIDLVFTDRSGEPIGRVWSPKYGSISSIRKGQLNFTLSKEALGWIKEVIRQKIENQQALLLMLASDDPSASQRRTKAISRLEDYRAKIDALEGE